MKTFHKTLVFSVILTLTFGFTSCKDDWEPFKWAYDNKNPETVAVTGIENGDCMGQITVVSDENEGDVVLLCENYANLYLEPSSKPSKPLDGVFDNGEASVKVDDNKIYIHFYTLSDLNEEHSMIILRIKTHEDSHPDNFLVLIRAKDINNPFPDE